MSDFISENAEIPDADGASERHSEGGTPRIDLIDEYTGKPKSQATLLIELARRFEQIGRAHV